MIVTRELSAERLNAVLNHPDVRADVADLGEGPLDVSAAVENPANVLLMGPHGGCLYFKMLPGIYEVHTQFVPEGRGAQALQFVRATGSWMFANTDAFELVTRIPAKHVAARNLALRVGMRLEFTRKDGCKFRGEVQDVDIYGIRIQDWISADDSFEAKGRRFHEWMHEEADRLQITDEPHGDDPNHNRYVGAALAMVEAAQIAKAVGFYNRWAIAARHRCIALISTTPPAVRFDIGTLTYANGQYGLHK